MALKNLGAILGKEEGSQRALYSVLEMEAYPRSYATMPGRWSRRLPGAWLKAKDGGLPVGIVPEPLAFFSPPLAPEPPSHIRSDQSSSVSTSLIWVPSLGIVVQ